MMRQFLSKYKKAKYLGDGLYAAFDGYHIILAAERENGIHWVGLESAVMRQLENYKKEIVADDARRLGEKMDDSRSSDV